MKAVVQEIKILPQKYYLQYFEFLLLFVRKNYSQLLHTEEKEILENYFNLTEEAKCIFVRMANRRGTYFHPHKFTYKEIEKLDEALDSLETIGFINRVEHGKEVNIQLLLGVYKLEELKSKFGDIAIERKDYSSKKAFIHTLTKEYPYEKIIENCLPDKIIIQNHEHKIEFFKFLFFAELHYDMSAFVVRDLGNLKFEIYKEAELEPAFKTRKEIDDKYLIAKIYEEFKIWRELLSCEDLLLWFQSKELERKMLEKVAHPIYDKMIVKLGKLLEQNEFLEEAAQIYTFTNQPPARERLVRIFNKLGKQKEAFTLCQEMYTSYLSVEEKVFASDFLNKAANKKSKKAVTVRLQDSETIYLKRDQESTIEVDALAYYNSKGLSGFFAENFLWRGLFGLFFWEIIFDQQKSSIHHPFQLAPSDIYSASFYLNRKKEFNERLSCLDNPLLFYNCINKTWEEKFGTVNIFFSWNESLLENIYNLYKYVGVPELKLVLIEMLKDVKNNGVGFPDLFIFTGSDYFFAEVKSVNDKLSSQQMFWIDFFNKINIKTKVIRVLELEE